MSRIYLDHISTTPPWSEVLEAMRPFLEEEWASPSSLHSGGLRARAAIREAREKVKTWIGARSETEVVFTSCGSESINMAVKGAAFRSRRPGNHVVVSAIEHPSVLGAVKFLEQIGYEITWLNVDEFGFLSVEELREAVRPETCLVCVGQMNHDLGVLQSVGELVDVVKSLSSAALCLVDATAGGGWAEVDPVGWGADLVALSPHRFYGPKGVGILYRSRRARLEPWLHGGDQELGYRAGTENVAAIVGAGVAAERVDSELRPQWGRIRIQSARFWENLKSRTPYVKLHGAPIGERRAPHHLNFSAEFIEGEGQALMLDALGVAVSSGSACASKALNPSHVLTAIGESREMAMSNIILGLGVATTDEELDRMADLYCDKVVPRLRGMSMAWEEFQASLK